MRAKKQQRTATAGRTLAWRLRWIGTAIAILGAYVWVTAQTSAATFNGSSTASAGFTANTSFGVGTPLWHFDAAQTTTLFSDAACTVPATSGSAVKCWVDASDPTRKITNSVSTSTVNPTTINGHRPVKFISGSRLFGADRFGGSTNNMQFFVVLRENAGSNNMLISFNGTDSGAARFGLFPRWSVTNTWYWDAGGTGTNRAVGPAAYGGPTARLVTGYKDPVAAKNGLKIDASTTYLSSGNVAAVTTGGLSIGDNMAVVNHDIAELIVYNQRLSATDQATVLASLKAKWGTP